MADIYEWINTMPVIKLVYTEGNFDKKELMEWVRQYAEAVTGRVIPKSQLVFDIEFENEVGIFKFCSLMCGEFNWGQDDDTVYVTLVYDWYTYDIKEKQNERTTEKENS